jgi:CubicO group peptidase (beta-lactamase class C family)
MADDRRGSAMPVGRRALYKSAAAFAAAGLLPAPAAAEPRDDIEGRVRGLVPDLERYVTTGMAAFDVPGTAVGVVVGDRLLYAKGFGQRRQGSDAPVGTKTIFQIGSTTKAFLAAALAIAVDRKKLKWDDRVVDLDPAFALKDPYVTREFRVYDLLAQRSGLPPYANDSLFSLYFDAEWLMHSLRFVEPITSFRSSFAYTNITHLIAGRIVAKALDGPDWPTLARREILAPLGMSDASLTAEAIDQAPDHAVGHRWTATGSVAIPFDPSSPYLAGPAGDINASLEDCAKWLRLQIGNGVFASRRLISADNLAATRTPKVAISETVSYAMGWVINATPNGRIIWHNGGTGGFGALIGFLPDKGIGIVVLTNGENKGFPDAVGLWALDKLLGNPETDYAKKSLAEAKDKAAKEPELFKRPAAARPPPDFKALAGDYASAALGPAAISPAGDDLTLTVKQTGARLRLEPFDGAVFTVRLIAEGRFAPVVAMQGDTPIGFAGFEADAKGRLTRLRWRVEDQVYLLQKTGGPLVR